MKTLERRVKFAEEALLKEQESAADVIVKYKYGIIAYNEQWVHSCVSGAFVRQETMREGRAYCCTEGTRGLFSQRATGQCWFKRFGRGRGLEGHARSTSGASDRDEAQWEQYRLTQTTNGTEDSV